VMKTAINLTAIVLSLFPSNVCNQLFATNRDAAEPKAAPNHCWESALRTGASALNHFPPLVGHYLCLW